ncbi:hypothetical protein ABZ957_33345 [Streptomyces sp. NPDC046316]|uniref:hypothetical protein n=1 Tax=Streptomyces sp. NPDC046316 TaxID=3154494 RepID=UPI0033F977DB
MSEVARTRALKCLMVGAAVSATLVSIGCTPEDKAKSSPTNSSSTSSPSGPPDSPTSNPAGSVEAAPKLPDTTAIATVANVSGNMDIPLKGGVHKGPLGIMVACQGKGTINVSYTPAGLSFPLKCVDGEVSTTYDQIELKHERESASVNVQAPSSVRWAMSVGQ